MLILIHLFFAKLIIQYKHLFGQDL